MKTFWLCALSLLLMLAAGPAVCAEDLSAVVARQAGILENLHDKARRALVTAAQDKVFAGYFRAHGARERTEHKHRIDQISLKVQERFHVEEMCLIDPKGAEISRIVGKKVAHDLALNESENPFFAPGFAQKPRSVYVSPIYVSPDADKWVVAYVTPIFVDGETKAILHYEHGLDWFQQVLTRGFEGADRFLLVIDQEGWVIADSRKPIAVAKKGEPGDPAAYFGQFALGSVGLPELLATAGNADRGRVELTYGTMRYEGAYQRMEGWTILALTRVGAGAI